MANRVVLECESCGEITEIPASIDPRYVRTCPICGGAFRSSEQPSTHVEIDASLARSLRRGIDLSLLGLGLVPLGFGLGWIVSSSVRSGWGAAMPWLLTPIAATTVLAAGLWRFLERPERLRGPAVTALLFNVFGVLVWVVGFVKGYNDRPSLDRLLVMLLLCLSAVGLWTCGFCAFTATTSRLADALGLKGAESSANGAFYLSVGVLVGGPSLLPLAPPLGIAFAFAVLVAVGCAVRALLEIRGQLDRCAR